MEQKVKSLYKALKLLDYFDEEHKEAGVTELAEYSGMLKSSVHNILQTFEACGYVTQNQDTRKYMLGGTIVALFSKYKRTRSLDYRVTVELQKIRDMFDVNVYLAERDNEHVVYLCQELANYEKDDSLNKEGARLPLHCTAAGKILLAYAPVEEKKKICSGELKSFTENTITDKTVLWEQLEKALYEGYATSNAEYEENRYCVAVPIIVGAGYEVVHYAIVIRKNERIYEYQLKRYIAELKTIGREVGSLLLQNVSRGKSSDK